MTLLTEDEITAGLGRAAGWERAGDSITRTVTLGDFRDAILYVGAVAHLAQAANHQQGDADLVNAFGGRPDRRRLRARRQDQRAFLTPAGVTRVACGC